MSVHRLPSTNNDHCFSLQVPQMMGGISVNAESDDGVPSLHDDSSSQLGSFSSRSSLAASFSRSPSPSPSELSGSPVNRLKVRSALCSPSPSVVGFSCTASKSCSSSPCSSLPPLSAPSLSCPHGLSSATFALFPPSISSSSPSSPITAVSAAAAAAVAEGYEGTSALSPHHPPPPFLFAVSSSSSSLNSATPCPKRKPQLSHHSSMSSAALAREFFGQKSSLSEPCLPRQAGGQAPGLMLSPGGGRGGLEAPRGRGIGSPTSSPLRCKMTCSPLLRRQATVDCETSASTVLSPSQLQPLSLNCLPSSPPAFTARNHPFSRQQTRPQGTRNPSLESCSSGGSVGGGVGQGDPPSPSSYFRIIVLGDDGVGKSTLVRQIVSEIGYGDVISGCDVEADDEDRQRVVVCINRNQERCTLEIFDSPLNSNIDTLRPDAFIVLYSVSDRKSYMTATEVTRHLRYELGMDRPVFLVANKTDLRRKHKVSGKEAKELGEIYDCGFLEISAALRLNVDKLLVRVVDQILEQLQPLSGGKDAIPHNFRSSGHRSSTSGNTLKGLYKMIRHALLKKSFSSSNVLMKK